MFIMWLVERITDRVSQWYFLIILVGIIARLRRLLIFEFTNRLRQGTGQGGLVMFLVEIELAFRITVGACFLCGTLGAVHMQRIVATASYGGARHTS